MGPNGMCQSETLPKTLSVIHRRRMLQAAYSTRQQRPVAYTLPVRGLVVPLPTPKRNSFSGVCNATGDGQTGELPAAGDEVKAELPNTEELREFRLQRLRRKREARREQLVYQISAIGATFLVTSMAISATYYRLFYLHDNGVFPWSEFAATLVLVFGGVVGMEMYARWAHKALWHDFAPAWKLHKSHHEPRTGPFELNDIFAVINAVPAFGLCVYGFVTPNLLGGICWGSGLGITLFGMMYMFVHDGLVHKRFPVGPIAEVPYLKRVAAAHKLHHMNDFNGLPWGLFLAEQELQGVPGAIEELEKLVARGDKS